MPIKCQWYNSSENNVWYESKYMSELDVPRCVSCDEYIISSKNSTPDSVNHYLCSQCIDAVNNRMNERVSNVLECKGMHKTSFTTEHIPEFSIITINYKGQDIITAGVDWNEILINDLIVENYDDTALESNELTLEDIEGDLLDFIVKLGNAMYKDFFDIDALRAKDSSLNMLIKNRQNINKKVVAWKAVDTEEYQVWEEDGNIPADTVFSPAEYYYLERENSTLDNNVLLKICAERKDVVMQRTGTVKLKKKLDWKCVAK